MRAGLKRERCIGVGVGTVLTASEQGCQCQRNNDVCTTHGTLRSAWIRRGESPQPRTRTPTSGVAGEKEGHA
jgi:hypothetical protein